MSTIVQLRSRWWAGRARGLRTSVLAGLRLTCHGASTSLPIGQPSHTVAHLGSVVHSSKTPPLTSEVGQFRPIWPVLPAGPCLLRPESGPQPGRDGAWSKMMNALAGSHDAAVQMIDTSMVRVHQHGDCITKNKRQSMGGHEGD